MMDQERKTTDRGNRTMAEQPARRNREELRELLIAIGMSILHEEGLGTGAEGLTFKKVFDRLDAESGIRLTNASVIRRLWLNLADFQSDVLEAIAFEENEDEIDLTVEAVGPVLDTADLRTPELRERTMRELCRVGGAANMQAVRSSDNWPLWISVWTVASLGKESEHRKRIEAALVSGYESFSERIESVYQAMITFVGFRLRKPLTMHQFSVAADSLGQGFGLRDRFDGTSAEPTFRPTGPKGQPQEWTLFAIAFEALVFHFFELDPDWVPVGVADEQ